MSDTDPIKFRPRIVTPAAPGQRGAGSSPPLNPSQTSFDRRELSEILSLYGRKVACGEWRDYAIDLGREKAIFSVFRRTSEWPLYRIEKWPKNARRQGAFSVISSTGLILKRGHELRQVLSVLEKRLHLVEG